MLKTIKSALKAARSQEQSILTGLIWAAEDLRGEAIEAGFNAGVPPLLLADLRDFPDLLGRAEYACKTPWPDFFKAGAVGDLIWQMNWEATQDWG